MRGNRVIIALGLGSGVCGIGDGSAFLEHGIIQVRGGWDAGNLLGPTSTINERMPPRNVPLVTLQLNKALDED
jgi:hypothetical protein